MENLFHSSPDMRRSQRKAYNKSIFFSFSPEQTKSKKVFYARAIDISETGIGIETDYPLAPGHTLWLNDGSLKTGTVKWIKREDNRYRAGIELHADLYEKSLAISETIEKYRIMLDEATDEFISQLEMIENRCLLSLKDERIIEDLDRIIDNMMSICKEFEEKAGYTKDELKKIISRFHRDTNPILSKSYCINRARTWPQGYQGDYIILEHIYRNIPFSEGIGYYLDLWALNTPLGHAVRNRIKKLEDILRREINRRYEPNILNIACGSCRELMGIANEIKERDARLICIDNDTDALNFAEIRLSSIGLSDRIDFRKYNALRMFDESFCQ